MLKFTTFVELLRTTGLADGGSLASEIRVRAVVIDAGDDRNGDYAAVTSGRIFLLAPDACPRPADRIRCDGAISRIKNVRACRDLDGVINAYRCTTVG